MRAMTVIPGVPASAGIEERPEPPARDGELVVAGRLLGMCGTDHEIAVDGYGKAPEGRDRLVLGHESLGEVVEAPAESGFAPGQLVAGLVRWPDPVPCPACAIGEPDMYSAGNPVQATTTTLKELQVFPQPIQKPHPQIWEPVTSSR